MRTKNPGPTAGSPRPSPAAAGHVGRTLRLTSTVALLAVGAAACLDDSITGTREASLTLSASASLVAVGDTVRIEYEATGTGLSSLRLDYGDGAADTVRFSGGFEAPDELPPNGQPRDTLWYRGPVAAGGWLVHVFEAPGAFRVVGAAVSGAGTAVDTLVFSVN